MSLTVNFIEGNRKTSCPNDAWSVVEGPSRVLAVIPLEQFPHAKKEDIREAFENAAQHTGTKNVTALVATARKILAAAPVLAA